MFKNLKNYAKLFWQMLKADIHIYNPNILTTLIDNFIWISCMVIISAYVLPKLGIIEEYGVFIAMGSLASLVFFEIYITSTNFLSDLEGNQEITYLITLPLPSWLIFIKQALGYAYRTMIIMPIILLLCKILLWNKVNFDHFSLIKFFLIFIILNFFGGIFSLFLSSMAEKIKTLNTAFIRILMPLWFFGSSQYSWKTLYSISPKFAYLNLLNPLTYAFEGIRNSILGSTGNINFWYCFWALVFFSLFLGFWSIKKMHKMLDFI
ncbi:hypothetical protein GF322_03175 [Candidatus Dependentiae bacterium]|nr:hypothetical protein [Candidatus Dependentiae bacterium]